MTNYSFKDLNVVIQHPSVGQQVVNGLGIGTISFAYATDRTQVETAADGEIMVSKIEGNSGTITLTIQQTSALHKWLLRWWNYIRAASASEYATASLTANAIVMGDQIVCIGIAPQKPADRPYAAAGQNVTWTLISADINQAA